MSYFLLTAIAIAGFLASLACEIMGWMRIDPPWGERASVLHFGMFILFAALVLSAVKTLPKPEPGQTRDLENVLAEVPKWVNPAIKIFFVNAFVCFIYFLCHALHYPHDKGPTYLEFGMASGIWMLAYGLEAIGFVALSRWRRKWGKTKPNSWR